MLKRSVIRVSWRFTLRITTLLESSSEFPRMAIKADAVRYCATLHKEAANLTDIVSVRVTFVGGRRKPESSPPAVRMRAGVRVCLCGDCLQDPFPDISLWNWTEPELRPISRSTRHWRGSRAGLGKGRRRAEHGYTVNARPADPYPVFHLASVPPRFQRSATDAKPGQQFDESTEVTKVRRPATPFHSPV
jgi:hypothetical protein